jgi:uncharacterized protein (DUF2336 family)
MTIATMRATLTQDDIRRLVRGASPEERANAAQKVCRRIDGENLRPADRALAEEILTILAEDAAELVRRTLAVTLRNSPNLPREVALRLAEDVDAVAVPILRNSPALTDADLLELVELASVQKQVAIAGRPRLGEALTERVLACCDRAAAETVAANEGAAFSDRAYDIAMERYRDDEGVKRALVDRERLPVHIAERLVTLVAGELFDRLVNRHELPPQLAIEIASGARERATLDLVEQAEHSTDLERFVQQLHLNGRLTPSLVIRAACLGNVAFAEWALAELSGIPRSKAWLMIHDAGSLGLKSIFERAGLPGGMFTAFRLAVSVYHQTRLDGGPGDRLRFRQRMLERVLTQFQGFPRPDLDYLLEKLDSLDEWRSRTAPTAVAA